MAISARRARGRPRVQDTARKRNNVTIRMRDELKSKIEQSAGTYQRSISQEIESRLERSFITEAGFGGPQLTQFAYLMASNFAIAGGRNAAGESEWLADPLAYANGVAAVLDALLRGFPNGPDKALAVEVIASRVLSRLAQEKEQANG
jgi:hypothetical protein